MTWKYIVAALFLLIIIAGIYAEIRLRIAKRNFRRSVERREDIQEELIRINTAFLKGGMTESEIMEKWKSCFAEAEIRYKLLPCLCENVNQCDTWCRAKARFVKNPPVD